VKASAALTPDPRTEGGTYVQDDSGCGGNGRHGGAGYGRLRGSNDAAVGLLDKRITALEEQSATTDERLAAVEAAAEAIGAELAAWEVQLLEAAETMARIEELTRAATGRMAELEEEAAKVAVPNVVGLTLAEALVRVRDVGLEPTLSMIRSDEPADTVVDQRPERGYQAGPGTLVTLFVSDGSGG